MPRLAAADPASDRKTQKRRLSLPRTGAAFLVIALLLAFWGAALLPGMWQKTQRREAYLPSLEAQAAHHPEDGPLMALVGARRMQAGEYDGAAEALRQAAAAGESGELVWRELAANVAASGDRTRALADLKLGLKSLPDSPVLQTALAQARAVPLDASPDGLARAIVPNGPAPLVAEYAPGSRLDALSAWWGHRHPEQSGYATRQAWALSSPQDAQAQRLWGEALLRNRRAEEALTVLTAALSLAPNSPRINLAFASALAQSGQASKAELAYLTCLTLHPDWLPALLGVGDTALENGLYPQATTAYTRATKIAPNSADAWIGAGRMQVLLHDPQLAVANFAQAARLAPQRTDFLNDQADLLQEVGRGTEAEALLRRRLTVAPEDSRAHYLLGGILNDNNPTPARVAEAEAQTREALRLHPNNPLGLVQMGQIMMQTGKPQEAVSWLTQALAVQPGDAKTLRVLVRAYFQAGDKARAAQASTQVLAVQAIAQQVDAVAAKSRAQPMNAPLHRKLADLYGRTGRPERARREAAIAALIEKDPKRAAEEMNKFDSLLQSALPDR